MIFQGGPDPLSPPLDPCMIGLGYDRFWKPSKHSLSAHHQNSLWIVEWHLAAQPGEWMLAQFYMFSTLVKWELIGEFHISIQINETDILFNISSDE